jgi:hypothetical protein
MITSKFHIDRNFSSHKEYLTDLAKIMFEANYSVAYIEATLWSKRDSNTSMDDIANIMIEAKEEMK